MSNPSAPSIVPQNAPTVRAQRKADKQDKNKDAVDRAGMSKEVVKAVLASPLTVAW